MMKIKSLVKQEQIKQKINGLSDSLDFIGYVKHLTNTAITDEKIRENMLGGYSKIYKSLDEYKILLTKASLSLGRKTMIDQILEEKDNDNGRQCGHGQK